MAYFDYHRVAKREILTGHLVRAEYLPVWNGIAPALVLFFDDRAPMPIRKEKWGEYEELVGAFLSPP